MSASVYIPPSWWRWGRKAWGSALRVEVARRRLERSLKKHRAFMRQVKQRRAVQ